ncbi:MAG: bifunctional heptose 7-phosphate kinase/heptose 1-phosphate adenyltransferase [Actinobacteria bacterium]|nr:bifunctional heptose 7-phosphate kinase/heptose 1-phosphate adenyltransferase [Actinomycetota bacterium]
MSGRLLIVGDALLDRDLEGRSDRLCPDAPVPVVDQVEMRSRPGGAGLAAVLAAGAGVDVTLVTALGRDAAGRELARALLGVGVDLVDLGLSGTTPEKIRVLDHGRPLMRLDRGAGKPICDPDGPGTLPAAIDEAAGILVSDYGRGVAAQPGVREALRSRPASTPLVWDPHPRGPEPIPGVDLATPNLSEAAARCGHESPPGGVARLAAQLRRRWSAFGVAVTCGGDGVVLVADSKPLALDGAPVEGDPCGAGDRFAVEAAWTLACGGDIALATSMAARSATAFVAAGGAHALEPPGDPDPLRGADAAGIGEAPLSIEPALSRAAAVRREGGTVVATGGCFDLLHAGHLQTLRAARRLGDCLIVLLNGDRSVARLKGPGRPVVDELERAQLLGALDCVDEVAIFDEDTPVETISLLRPDVWVKGGDYAIEALPERDALAPWGGRVAVLPFLAGKSTTRLIEKVGHHD